MEIFITAILIGVLAFAVPIAFLIYYLFMTTFGFTDMVKFEIIDRKKFLWFVYIACYVLTLCWYLKK